MKVDWLRCSTTCKLAALTQLIMPIALAQTPDTNAALEARVRELEKTQQRLLEEMRKQRKAVSAAPAIGNEDRASQSKEIDQRAREIEERIAAQGEAPVFFSPSTTATSEMRAYYKRLVAKLEDCGTRYFPKRGEKSVYGSGLVSIELDQGGNAVTMKVERSSADELIDKHMLKLIAASTPFGPTPERIRPQDERRYERLVVLTSFEFKRDTTPPKSIEASKRCKL